MKRRNNPGLLIAIHASHRRCPATFRTAFEQALARRNIAAQGALLVRGIIDWPHWRRFLRPQGKKTRLSAPNESPARTFPPSRLEIGRGQIAFHPAVSDGCRKLGKGPTSAAPISQIVPGGRALGAAAAGWVV